MLNLSDIDFSNMTDEEIISILSSGEIQKDNPIGHIFLADLVDREFKKKYGVGFNLMNNVKRSTTKVTRMQI